MPLSRELALAGKFLTELLEVYDQRIIERTYPELWGYEGRYHMAMGDLPYGAETYRSMEMDLTGRAVNFGGKATNIPEANFGISGTSYQAKLGVLSASWSWTELNAEQVASGNPMYPQVNVVENYGRALDKGLREYMHLNTIFGDNSDNQNFAGLLTNPFIEVVNVPAADNGLTGPGQTAADAYDWIRLETSNFRKRSWQTAPPTGILTSEDVTSAFDQRYAEGSGETVLDSLMGSSRNNVRLATINPVNEFSGEHVINPEIGNLTSIGGVPITADVDLLLMTGVGQDSTPAKKFSPIDRMPPFTNDGGMTWTQIGIVGISEMMYNKPLHAKLFVLNKA